jgi:hypothetical protein
LSPGRIVLIVVLIALGLYLWRVLAPETIPPALAPWLEVAAPSAPPARDPVLYKWRDDQGQWNITDQPPKDRPYEVVTVDPNTNVLPAGVGPEPLPR